MPASIEDRIRVALLPPDAPPGQPLNGWDRHLLARWLTEPHHFRHLEHRVLDLLAVPQLRCGRRDCRRRGGCSFRLVDSGEPACLDNLDAAQKTAFAALRRAAMRRYFSLERPEDEAAGELQRASLELELAIAPPGDRRVTALRRFWRDEARRQGVARHEDGAQREGRTRRKDGAQDKGEAPSAIPDCAV